MEATRALDEIRRLVPTIMATYSPGSTLLESQSFNVQSRRQKGRTPPEAGSDPFKHANAVGETPRSTKAGSKNANVKSKNPSTLSPRSRGPERLHKASAKAAGSNQGRKRLLTHPPQLPASPHGPEASPQWMDEQYIRMTMTIPTKADYPRAASILSGTPKVILHSVPGRVLRLKSDFAVPSPNHWRCTASAALPEGKVITAIGEGPLKRPAESAAFLHLLAKLHQDGILKEIWGEGAAGDKVDDQTLLDEVDAKLDVYDYAARFDCVPTFKARLVNRLLRPRGRKAIELSIDLPEQKIHVVARGASLRAAEVSASLKFKAEAEKYHAEHGDDTIVIKDATTLNTGNARVFFEWYSMQAKGTNIHTVVEPEESLKDSGNVPFRGQLFLNNKPIGEPVVMINKKRAEGLAYLTAAIALKREDPRLYPQFRAALRSGNGDILRPVPPVDMNIDSESEFVMRETLHGARQAGLTDLHEEVESDEDFEQSRRVRSRSKLVPSRYEERNADLRHRLDAFNKDPSLAKLRKTKEELPMNRFRAKVMDLVENNMYSIVVGATGSGKTTQVPQILLENAIMQGTGSLCNVVCTQPRRIAATSVARRVAVERNETIQRSVGYQVRFDTKLPELGGSITYCTTGILLQQLQHTPNEILDGTSHIIIDEVHERSTQIDFLLIILKKVMEQRVRDRKSTPKVVLMSATMDTELFAGYFNSTAKDGSVVACPSISVPGRTFPVTETYFDSIWATLKGSYPDVSRFVDSDPATREYLASEQQFSSLQAPGLQKTGLSGDDESEALIDWKRERIMSSEGEVAISSEREDALVPTALVATTIAHIAKTTKEGAVLAFLPGLDEILKVSEKLRDMRPLGVNFSDGSKFKISMLHSSLPEGQADIFNPVPEGCRKIILATNIAETSVTIPDVQYVVDTGKLREKRYDQTRRITKLQCKWISKSNAKQRAGRAGRVQNGNYFALFSKARYEFMRAVGLPEMLRSDLQEICLDIRAQAFKAPIRQFLSAAIEPPSPRAVDASIESLQDLEALTDEEELTPLGRLLASLPVYPALGKMIVLGIVFRCLDPMLILGAAAGERQLFVSPLELRQQSRKVRADYAKETGSDHIALINAFRSMRELRDQRGYGEMRRVASESLIHHGTFRLIDQTIGQIEDILVEAGLIPVTHAQDRYKSEVGDPALNENASKTPLINALALSGMHPNLAVQSRGRLFRTPQERGVVVHPSSINATRGKEDENKKPRGALLTYSSMAKASDGKTIFLRETSEAKPLMAALFGGRLKSRGSVLEMDGWLPFYVKGESRALKTVVEFRKALDRLLTNTFMDLTRRRGKTNKYLADDPAREIFAQGVVEVLDLDVRYGEAPPKKGW
ncbi:MAG: hypothetical protein M1837_001794, partial [Sclerophora amabilis]